MIQGTTPTIRLKIDALDLTQCHDLHVTLKQAGHDRRDFSGAALDVEEHAVQLYLTQEQSLMLAQNKCDVQVNGLTASGVRWATKVKTIEIGKQLLQEVIG